MSERSARLASTLELAVFASLIALAIGLRFYHLGYESVWLDEATTFMRARLPLDKLLADTIHRHHVPPYFLLMHYVLKLGDDEFMLRLPSAIFGSLALLASIALGAIVAGLRGGLVTGVLLGLAPQFLRYCQEARMYAMFVFFSTSALCGLLWLVREREAAASWPFPRGADRAHDPAVKSARRAWLTYAFGTLGVLYTHNTGVLFWLSAQFVGLVIWLALPGRRRDFFLNWLCLNALVLFVFAPWLKVLLVQAKEVSENFWAAFPTRELIVETLDQLYLFGSHEQFPGLFALGFAGFGLWSLRDRKPLAISLVLLSVLQPILILLVSLHRPIWILRLMLWGTVPFFVLVAAGVAALKRRELVALAVFAFVLAGGSALRSGYLEVTHKPEWSRALRYAAAQKDVAVFMIGPREHRPIQYYTERNTDRLSGFELVGARPKNLDQGLAGHNHVVIFVSNKNKRAKPILAMMKTRGKLLHHDTYGPGLALYEYRVAKTYAKPSAPPPPGPDDSDPN